MTGVQLLARLVVDEISTVAVTTVESPIKFFVGGVYQILICSVSRLFNFI